MVILPKSINVCLKRKVLNELCDNCEAYIVIHSTSITRRIDLFIDFCNDHKSVI